MKTEPGEAAHSTSPAPAAPSTLKRFLLYLGQEELIGEGCQLSTRLLVGEFSCFWHAWPTSYVVFSCKCWSELEFQLTGMQYEHDQYHRGEPRLVWLD